MEIEALDEKQAEKNQEKIVERRKQEGATE
jgi:hypothetical protein